VLRSRLSVVVVGVGLVAGLGCASGKGGTSNGSASDAGAELACTHFRNVAKDQADGLLTRDELRTKLKQVASDAQGATHQDINDQARAMVAAATSGDDEGLGSAVRAFDAACKKLNF
jgi:hypothetical protein